MATTRCWLGTAPGLHCQGCIAPQTLRCRRRRESCIACMNRVHFSFLFKGLPCHLAVLFHRVICHLADLFWSVTVPDGRGNSNRNWGSGARAESRGETRPQGPCARHFRDPFLASEMTPADAAADHHCGCRSAIVRGISVWIRRWITVAVRITVSVRIIAVGITISVGVAVVAEA